MSAGFGCYAHLLTQNADAVCNQIIHFVSFSKSPLETAEVPWDGNHWSGGSFLILKNNKLGKGFQISNR